MSNRNIDQNKLATIVSELHWRAKKKFDGSHYDKLIENYKKSPRIDVCQD
jgi:hypothetical protein